MTSQPVQKGISSLAIATKIPKNWSPEWFREFVVNFLALTDVRNASTTASSTSTSLTGNVTATIGPSSSSVDQPAQVTVTTNVSGVLDPSSTQGSPHSGFIPTLAKGNMAPMVQDQTFSYTSTSSSIQWSWNAYNVYRPDGTSFAVTSGSQNVTGLSASTTYVSYAYSTEAAPTTITFATGFSGSAGTPSIAFNTASATSAQLGAAFAAASVLSNIYQGKATGTTPASGTGGGGGGGGGYGGCPHHNQLLDTSQGRIEAGRLRVGDRLHTPIGLQPIIALSYVPREEWIICEFNTGSYVTVSPSHRFVLPDDEVVMASELTLGQIIQGNDHNLQVKGLRLLSRQGTAVRIELDDPHLYFFTKDGPLNHNLKP